MLWLIKRFGRLLRFFGRILGLFGTLLSSGVSFAYSVSNLAKMLLPIIQLVAFGLGIWLVWQGFGSVPGLPARF